MFTISLTYKDKYLTVSQEIGTLYLETGTMKVLNRGQKKR